MINLMTLNIPIAWVPSGGELVIIFAVLLLLFGGKKLPELARSLGQAKNEFRKGAKEVENELSRVSRNNQEDSKNTSVKKG